MRDELPFDIIDLFSLFVSFFYCRFQGNSPLSSAKLGDIYTWMRRSLKETVLSHKLHPSIGKSRHSSGGLSI